MQIYKSKEAAEYFSKNRNKLEAFYKSEQAILHEFVSDISKENDFHTISPAALNSRQTMPEPPTRHLGLSEGSRDPSEKKTKRPMSSGMAALRSGRSGIT